MSLSLMLRPPWPRAVGLKADVYLNLAFQNPWLLGCCAKVRNDVRYRVTTQRETLDTRRAGPVSRTLNLTRRCNMACRFCIVGDVLNKAGWQAHEATVESIRPVLSHPVARRCLYVRLTGGEPLLTRDLVPICRLVRAHRHILSVNTNGLLLEDHVEDLRAAGGSSSSVSTPTSTARPA